MSTHAPSRRELLAVVAAAVGGGCLDDTTSTTRSASATPTRADVGPDWPTPDSGTRPGYTTDPVATAVVGDADQRPSNVKPHQVVVRNGTADASTTGDTTTADATRITTRVWRDGTRVIARTDTLAAGRDLLVDLREPGQYLVAVRAARDERGVVVSNRERTWFDCNDSATTVAVTPDGYARGFITTDLACSTPD